MLIVIDYDRSYLYVMMPEQPVKLAGFELDLSFLNVKFITMATIYFLIHHC